MPELVPVSIARLLSLLAWIGDHPGISVDGLAAHFHRTRRQILRDVEALGSVGDSLPGSSFEIDWDLYEREGKLRIESTMGLDLPPRLTRREAQAILVGLAALEPNLDEDLRRRIPRTALAVKALVGEEADPPLLVHSDSPGLDLLDDLADAISKGRPVSFTYTDARGARSERVVEPWEVRFDAGAWMLRGWCRTAGAERTFAVRRIEGLALEKGRIAVRERPVRTAGRVEEILVDSSKRWVAEEFDAVSALPDGDALRLRIPVWNEDWFSALLIDLAPGLRSGPEEALARAGERARRVLRIWDEAGPAPEEGE